MKKRIIALCLVLIMAAAALPITQAAVFPFTDVPSYHKDRTAIEFCFINEFVKGSTETQFNPDSTLTREQFAVIWGRTFHLRRHGFNDVTRVPNEFENAILVMQALGHVNGLSDTQFGRTESISREQAIAITQRAYLPGIDGNDAYKSYADQALISDWARDSISVCKEKGLLEGVFTGNELKPGKPITRGEICHLIYNIMRVEHEIRFENIGLATGSVKDIVAKEGKYYAYPGETVTIEVIPNEENTLVTGSLKYNDTPITETGSGENEYTFIMPFEDAVITAQTAKKLASLTVTGPSKKEYVKGDKLDLTGLSVTAVYEGGSTAAVTNYTASPTHDSIINVTGSVNVTITYSENGVTITEQVPIQVSVS